MADTYYIDFETQSPVNLLTKGLFNYVYGEGTDIVCMAYKKNNTPTKIWMPGEPWPLLITKEDTCYAHNAQFDYLVWNILAVGKYKAHPLHIDSMIDSMALCGRYTIPQSLAMAGAVMGIKMGKDVVGKKLMKKICIYPYSYTSADMQAFVQYCKRDVDAMYELIYALPYHKLSTTEQAIWKQTVIMNFRGVPVDKTSVMSIYRVNLVHVEKANRELPIITNGAVEKHTQAIAIVRWAATRGVNMPNCTASTVVDFLELNLPLDVRKVLQIRQSLSLTSTAKYKKFMELDYNGRIYQNLRYYAASTGRWGGMGAQLHNLPRASVDDPEGEIKKFEDRSILRGNPLASAKALVRAMIKAPDGSTFAVSDYSSIENRGAMWLCNEFAALESIRQGKDQYVEMAADIYMKAYDDISKPERALGKTVVLGAVYNLGGPGFKKYAAGYGIDITDNEAQLAIIRYREKYPNVVKYWYRSKETMINAIKDKGHAYEFGKCSYACAKDNTGRWWLCLRLPSGRSLFYMEPDIKMDEYGELPTHMGLNSYTRKWSALKIVPGRIIENIVQGMSRDILAFAKLKAEAEGIPLILSVHDELVAECKQERSMETYTKLLKIMRLSPPWCPELPLDADGYISNRYKKG